MIIVRFKFRVKGSSQCIPLVTTVTRGTLPAANCFHFFYCTLDPVDSIRVQEIHWDTKSQRICIFFFFLFFFNNKKDTGEGGLDRAEHLAKATNRGVNLALAPLFLRREEKSEKSAP